MLKDKINKFAIEAGVPDYNGHLGYVIVDNKDVDEDTNLVHDSVDVIFFESYLYDYLIYKFIVLLKKNSIIPEIFNELYKGSDVVRFHIEE